MHERLREWAKRSNRPELDAAEEITQAYVDDYFCDMQTLFREFADEIERYYIPRPRFENGEPVQFGDVVQSESGEADRVYIMTFYGNGSALLRDGTPVDICELDNGEFIKRPTPKVLDADGVEYKQGQTVWSTDTDTLESAKVTRVNSNSVDVLWSDGERGECINPLHLTHERPVFDANGERICKGDACWYTDRLLTKRFRGDKVTVKGIYENGITVYNETRGFSQYELSPESLTHREPDSLEKLQDLISAIDNVHGGSNTELHLQLDKAYDMCTALIEKGA